VVIGSEAKKFLGFNLDGIFTKFAYEMGTGKSSNVFGRIVTPIELTTLLLRKVVADYADQFGAPSIIAITWPANYRNEQREATKEAALRAGLSGIHFIEESEAVALYHRTYQRLDGKYLIQVFNGDSLEVTLIEAKGNNIRILHQDGVLQLGEKDLDGALHKIIGGKFQSKTGHEFVATDCSFNKYDIESAKIILSTRDAVFLRLLSDQHGPVLIDVSRDEFEAGISHLIAQAEMASENVLRCGKDDPSLHTKKSDIREIFMVGGISRVPAMQAAVERLFGKKPKLENPEQAIALGAAIYAAHKAGKEILNATQLASLRDFKVNPVAPHFIGTSAMVPDGSGVFNDTVIAKGTPLPCKVERTYYTTTHNQAVVNVDVTQSAIEERDLDFVTKLWEGSLKLPRGCPAGHPIKVTYYYDINGTVAMSVNTGGGLEGPGVTAKLIRPGPSPLEQ
jgi:molecular chaperone DnaK